MRGPAYGVVRGAAAGDVVPGLRDGVRGRRVLLQDLQPAGGRVQRGQLHPLHQPARRHLAQERAGNQDAGRDPLREGDHLPRHGAHPRRGHQALGRKGAYGLVYTT